MDIFVAEHDNASRVWILDELVAFQKGTFDWQIATNYMFASFPQF